MGNETQIALIFVGVAALLAVSLFVNAVILRAAVSLSNKLAGIEHSENPIPEPSTIKGMGIILVAGIANFVTGYSIGEIIPETGLLKNMTQVQSVLVPQLVALPVGFLVISGMLAATLPTTFVRGMLVAFCQFLISLSIAVFLGGASFLVLYMMK